MKAFRLIGVLLTYLPMILTAIKTVEALVDPGTPGVTKRTLVISALKGLIERSGKTVSPALLEVIGDAVDMAVSLFNLVGLFRHKDEEPEADEVLTPPVVSSTVAAVRARAAVEGDPALQEFLERTAR